MKLSILTSIAGGLLSLKRQQNRPAHQARGGSRRMTGYRSSPVKSGSGGGTVMSSPSPPDDVGSGVGSGFGVDGAGVSGRGVDGLGVDGTGVSGRGVDGFGVDGAGVSGRGVGFTVGLAVGFAVGLVVGFAVGLAVGFAVSFGFSVGVGVSSGCGVSEGAGVPEAAGVSVGAGAAVGVSSGVGSGSAANSASSEVSGSHAPPSASYSTMPALKRTGGSASFGSSYTVSSAGVLPAPAPRVLSAKMSAAIKSAITIPITSIIWL